MKLLWGNRYGNIFCLSQDEEIDRVFDQIYEEQDPQYKRLCQFVEDPRWVTFFLFIYLIYFIMKNVVYKNRKMEDPTRVSRIPLAMLIDSTKIEVPKSADFQHQKSTHFKDGKVYFENRFEPFELSLLLFSGHYITRESITDCQGTVLYFGKSTVSISPGM